VFQIRRSEILLQDFCMSPLRTTRSDSNYFWRSAVRWSVGSNNFLLANQLLHKTAWLPANASKQSTSQTKTIPSTRRPAMY